MSSDQDAQSLGPERSKSPPLFPPPFPGDVELVTNRSGRYILWLSLEYAYDPLISQHIGLERWLELDIRQAPAQLDSNGKMQSPLQTMSRLSRHLQVRNIRPEHVEISSQGRKDNPDAIAAARKEATEVLEGIGMLKEEKGFMTVEYRDTDVVVERDAKSLRANVTKKVGVQTRKRDAAFHITKTTVLLEMMAPRRARGMFGGPAAQQQSDALNERCIRLAREEIQGAWERIWPVLERAEPIQEVVFRLPNGSLDRDYTGIFAVEAERECEYCERGHRNGECYLNALGRVKLVEN